MPPPLQTVPLTGSDEEFSDDDNAPDAQPTYEARPSYEGIGWDVFRNPPPPNASLSENSDKYMAVTVKCLKVFAFLFTFAVVLAGGVITKGTVLLMASQLKNEKTLPLCTRDYDKLRPEKDYMARIPAAENVAWAWMLFFAYIIPELGTWFRSSRMCIFKKWTRPRFGDLIVVILFEILHAVGTAMLIYIVLPDLDVIKGAMLTNCVAFIPGLFGMLSRDKKESSLFWKILVDILALICQVSGFFVWPILEMQKGNGNIAQIWTIPFAVFLISFGWWENYVDNKSKISFVKYLGGIKQRLWKTRYFTYIFASLIKCLVFFGVMVISMGMRLNNDYSKIFDLSTAFSSHIINVTETRQVLPGNLLTDGDLNGVVPLKEVSQIWSDGSTPVYVFLIQVTAAYICYIFGKFACKICIQGFSFAFPVNLTIPVSISLLITACGLRTENVCAFDFMPGYLFWECKNGDILTDFLKNDYAWIWLLWLLSQTWITLHIWTPKCERLASTEKLFVSPMYNTLLIDQSLALNRRRDDDPEVNADEITALSDEHEPESSQHYETISLNTDSSNTNATTKTIKSSDHITRIFACATMWHEDDDEMMEMLKSILRMDEDQSARRITLKFLNIVDNDYYEFETHIFFDDAFEISDADEEEHVVNKFVKSLVILIDSAAKHVHQTSIRIRPPKRVPAPYGGRLVWTLPGKTKIVAHLKDKDKIRHKKRWSQVMYMYYLLGFKLMDQPISVDRKEIIAENTFLLTLDGDIDFTPKAVALLIDLMKKNTNLGAACGRIHPVGSGLMVWYQMFEYAIGHWLQKATEHMIGCVLCSPGCFSLFRGRALMDDNVMNKYTTTSSRARHYVQYDQGEDRWLCTLLLQRGYRVEYSAASDAYTHCPEGFGEFYNQRRRWVPSTMANIMDLLQDYQRTIKINDNISLPYICYQTMLMAGTILGPGTIFLMLVGAFVAAFNIGNWPSFQYNIYPILFFMVICFFANSVTQMKPLQMLAAQILSAGYALAMMSVIVGTTLQLDEDGVGSPSAIFLIALSGSFFISACMHPQEFQCIIPGMLYLMCIPSMYLLLIIYSLINLNDVSWGTREIATKKTKKEQLADKKALEEAEKERKAGGILGMLNRGGKDDESGSIEFSLAGLFKVMCCIHPKQNEGAQIAMHLDEINKKMTAIENQLGIGHSRRKSTMQPRVSIRSGDSHITTELDDEVESLDGSSQASVIREERDELVNPYWIEDEKAVRRGEIDYLPQNEVQFWKDLIERYLFPLNKDNAEQKKIQVQLKELRNTAVFSFVMMNAIFVIIVFLLQLNKDKIHINWPLGIKTNITYDPDTNEIHITKTYLQLEPIGLVFVFFFALILVIQFTAMLFHRFGTISHILASTELSCCCADESVNVNEKNLSDKKALETVRYLQKLRGANNDDYESSELPAGRRKTIANITRSQKNKAIGTLDVAFQKRYFSIAGRQEGEPGSTTSNNNNPEQRRRATILAFADNYQQTSQQKNKMMTLGGTRAPPTRTSIASEMDNQRIFTPPNGSLAGDINTSVDYSLREGSVKYGVSNGAGANLNTLGKHAGSGASILYGKTGGSINGGYVPSDTEMIYGIRGGNPGYVSRGGRGSRPGSRPPSSMRGDGMV